jgi:hypothetical protein
MRVTINRVDGLVGIEGMFKALDLSSLPSNLRVVQWNGSSGHVEWTDQNNTTISSFADYQQYIDAYNALQPETPPEPTIEQIRASMSCGPLQIRKALRAAGLHAGVVAYVAAADEETQEAWEYAGEFNRLDPFILAAQVALNKTDEEVDGLFQLALTF